MRLLGYVDSAVNPLRRLLGVETSELPEGMTEVDYMALLDAVMHGFGGADVGRKPVNRGSKPKKMQDRVPQPRGSEDMAAGVQPGSVLLARRMSGDMPPDPRSFGLDTKMKLMMRRR